jgi:hypothetical protein
MHKQKEIQQKFFSELKGRRNQKTFIAEVMQALDIKNGAVYKRMSGETALTLEESLILSERFKVSLDSITEEQKFISFMHPFGKKENATSDKFVSQFKKFFAPLKEIENDVELTYLANELPIFYYFGHKYILNFLMSIWQHLHWKEAPLSIGDSSLYEEVSKQFHTDILTYYYRYKVTEIWNSNMLNNLFQQIIFCITIRAFENAQFINMLINDIANLISHLRSVSTEGAKSIKGTQVEGSELRIYLNDFGNYLNILQFDSKEIQSTFIGYDYPQFLVSSNKDFFLNSKEWINKLKKRSVLISSEGYQYRELFFIKMETDFKNFKDRTQKLMSIYYES